MDKLLLHTCCGVCGVYVLEQLKKQFDVTAYFFNPNIHPKEEYERRKNAVKEIINHLNSSPALPFPKGENRYLPLSKRGIEGDFVEGDYRPEDWFAFLEKSPVRSPTITCLEEKQKAKPTYVSRMNLIDDPFTTSNGVDFKTESEGGRRCPVCFRMRLEESARYAKENNFEWLATTLTMGRNKRADIIDPIGKAAAEKYGLRFYEADWKKQNGQLIAHKLAKEKNIYHQHYCGCVYSMRTK